MENIYALIGRVRAKKGDYGDRNEAIYRLRDDGSTMEEIARTLCIPEPYVRNFLSAGGSDYD